VEWVSGASPGCAALENVSDVRIDHVHRDMACQFGTEIGLPMVRPATDTGTFSIRTRSSNACRFRYSSTCRLPAALRASPLNCTRRNRKCETRRRCSSSYMRSAPPGVSASSVRGLKRHSCARSSLTEAGLRCRRALSRAECRFCRTLERYDVGIQVIEGLVDCDEHSGGSAPGPHRGLSLG
jgi:hypothetical protein